MSRINIEPLFTFPDGSHLVVSTQCQQEGQFACALYRSPTDSGGSTTFEIISNHLAAATCLEAQHHAYQYALRLYPSTSVVLKKPPYLIWPGPRSVVAQ
jgi:hypothetical protein